MIIAVVGLNHEKAPVEVREKLAFPERILGEALERLRGVDGVSEGMIVSTCNRVELYAVGPDEEALVNGLIGFLADYHQFPAQILGQYLYRHTGAEAIRHVMRVSSSLNSMIMGEPQILGQVKEAFDRALETGCTGKTLNELMKKTISVAKLVRTDTGIASGVVSISSAAVDLARKIFTDLGGKSVMVIGAGEMAEDAITHLIAQGATDILVANRTFEKAVELARRFNGSAIKFEDLVDYLTMSDIVISSTGAPHIIITPEMARSAISSRKNRPMFLIDIAVPRDIDPAVNDLDNVYLYDIDDLQSVVAANRKEREKEAEKARAIIERELAAFIGWLDSLEVVPTIVSLREKLEAIKAVELEKAMTRLAHLPDRDREAVKALASGIVNKILHEPITVLKKDTRTGDAVSTVETLRRLFGLTHRDEDKGTNG